MREKIERVLERMRKRGHKPVIWETHRTSARQEYLWGFGRLYDDGRGVVTYSRNASETWHGFWLAVDIIDAVLQWNATAQFWADLGDAYRAEGMLWGNDWDRDGVPTEKDADESFSDRPHGQWFPMRRKPSANAQLLYATGGYPAVWREVGALA